VARRREWNPLDGHRADPDRGRVTPRRLAAALVGWAVAILFTLGMLFAVLNSMGLR
jgi:hypothetical protein